MEEEILLDEPLAGEVIILVLTLLQAHGALPLRLIEHQMEETTGLKRELKLTLWRMRESGLVDCGEAKIPLKGYRMHHYLTPVGSVVLESFQARIKRVRRTTRWTKVSRG